MQIALQYIYPQQTITRLVGSLANSQNITIKNLFIRWFIKHYEVDMSEALQPDYRQYASFNDFFTRHLQSNLRPLPPEPNAIASPVDGSIIEIGDLHQDQILQAKGIFYNLPNLLACDANKANYFNNGSFATFYLAPKNYHRFHMPITGRLVEMQYVPGRLFSVNPIVLQGIKGIFTRNERVICWFETEVGLMSFIAIGALNVGQIVTSWHGAVNADKPRQAQTWDFRQQNIVLPRGAEVGYFQMGSSVIVLFPDKKVQWSSSLTAGSPVKMGQNIGSLKALRVTPHATQN